jgi:hypothetical protein
VIFALQQGTGSPVANQLLSVVIQVGAGQQPPQLSAVVIDGSGEPVLTDGKSERTAAVTSRHPGLIALTVTEPVLIRISPPDGLSVFPSDSTYSVIVGPEGRDADRLMLRSLDASGLQRRDVITMVPLGGEVMVSAVGHTAEPVLPPLAAKARTAAREVLGMPTVSAEQAVALAVAVDTSASMQRCLGAGTVSNVLQLLMGLGQVVASSQRVGSNLVGQSLSRLPDQPLDAFALPVTEAARAMPPSIGFRSDLVPDAGAQAVTYVLTDAVPADLPSARTDLLHLVVLAAGADEEMAQPRPSWVGGSVIATDQDWDALGQLEVKTMVSSLLLPYRLRFFGGAR